MKRERRGGPSRSKHPCRAARALPSPFRLAAPALCGLVACLSAGALSAAPAAGGADGELGLEDYAVVYLDRYFEPGEGLLLSEEGRRRSQALASYAIGRSLEAQGRPLEAVEAYKRVIENQPEQHFLARKTAHLLARSGNQDQALALLERNLEENPDEPFAYISLSEYLATYHGEESDSRRRAFEVIEEAAERFPDESAVYEHLVKLCLMTDRRAAAERALEQAAARDNSDPRYWLQLGRVAQRVWTVRPDGDSAGERLVNRIHAKALDLAGEDAGIFEQVGDYYHGTKQYPEAVEAYRRAIEVRPDDLEVREKLARVYGGLGNEEMVVRTLEEIVEIDPQNARTLKQIAGIHLRAENYKAAIGPMRRALAITKGNAAEYGALARMMIEAEEFEVAADFLEETAPLFPESAEFPFLLTFALGRLERWEDALPQFERTVELAEDAQPELLNESFHFRYAAAHERAGNIEEAEALFRRTIEMIALSDPENENEQFTALVYNYLGYMWLENDMNIDEAGELIKTAVDLYPESGAIVDSLGWYYFKKEDYEQSLRELLRAEKLIEEPDPVVYDHIGRAYHKLGKNAEAVEYLEKAVELDPENEEFNERLRDYRAAAEGGKPDAAGEDDADDADGAADPAPAEAPADGDTPV